MWCASAAGSTRELAGASVAAAVVEHPASFFPLAFVMPEPSAALFFFADVLPFFVRAALGTFFDGAAAARDGAGAMPPGAVVIRGGKKRLRARPTLGGAPAVATPALAALGFPVAAAGGSRLYSGVSGAPVCASMGGWQGAGAGARGA